MPQPYFVNGLIGKVLAYGGLQIRKYIPHGLQPTNERRAESKLAYSLPSKEEEDKVKSLRTRLLCWLFLFRWLQFVVYQRAMRTIFPHVLKAFAKAAFSKKCLSVTGLFEVER